MRMNIGKNVLTVVLKGIRNKHQHEWQDTGFATVEDCAVKGCNYTRSNGHVFSPPKIINLPFGYALWPNWYGSFIDWSYLPHYDLRAKHYSGFKFLCGKCYHGTAWQIRIDTKRWSWYLVLRNRKKFDGLFNSETQSSDS
jgi:hypothetical protein